MGSLNQARIEGFICRLCSLLDANVIHIYSDEGIAKNLEYKINVYLQINVSKFDPLPKTICCPCSVKLDQHHRFMQRVIENQKKIEEARRLAAANRNGMRTILRRRRSLRLAAIAAHNRYATPNANIEPNSVPEGDSENSDEAPQPPPRNVRRIGLPTYPEELEDEPVNDRRRMVRFRISRIDPDATSANPGSGDMSR